MSDEIPTFDLGEFCGDLKAALDERFTEVTILREATLDDAPHYAWWFTAAVDVTSVVNVRVGRECGSGLISGVIWADVADCGLGPMLATMAPCAVSPTSAIIKLLCNKMVSKIRSGGVMMEEAKAALAAAKPGTPFHAAVAEAVAKHEQAIIANVEMAAMREAFGQVSPKMLVRQTVQHKPEPERRVNVQSSRYNDIGTLAGGTISPPRPSLLTAARLAGVAAPPTEPAPVLDADGGRDLPSPVGFDSPADLRRLGRRPLVTCDDGPAAGWATYDDEV